MARLMALIAKYSINFFIKNCLISNCLYYINYFDIFDCLHIFYHYHKVYISEVMKGVRVCGGSKF